MSTFECSPQQLRNAATNASTIGRAIATHPVHALAGGDIGHAEVAAALESFRSAWSGELRLRDEAAQQAARLLNTAAADTQHLDALLAHAAAGLGDGG
ncbi:hypothetical protein ACFVWR_13700 [Leifsonia sp. NPDC058292]|uniref:hypothetical protein n=1 Tax=Leifsonia sp. NPDC058292 TaxID=3346428 RepID=UPI0036DAE1FE